MSSHLLDSGQGPTLYTWLFSFTPDSFIFYHLYAKITFFLLHLVHPQPAGAMTQRVVVSYGNKAESESKIYREEHRFCVAIRSCCDYYF